MILLAPMLAAAVARGDVKAAPGCGSYGLPADAHVGSTPVAGRMDDHRRLRAGLGLPVPEASFRIAYFASGGDLATTTISVIGTRGSDGLWHVDGTGQNQIWVQGAKPTVLKRLDYSLDPAASRQLDNLIGDACLLNGPRSQAPSTPPIGALGGVLEIRTPTTSWVGGWFALPTTQEQAIIDLLVSKQ